MSKKVNPPSLPPIDVRKINIDLAYTRHFRIETPYPPPSPLRTDFDIHLETAILPSSQPNQVGIFIDMALKAQYEQEEPNAPSCQAGFLFSFLIRTYHILFRSEKMNRPSWTLACS